MRSARRIAMAIDTAAVERDVAAIREHGFVVVRDLLSAEQIVAMRQALAPHLRAELLGRNDFEGFRTERVYSLVGRDPLFADLVEHPHVLAICDAFLEPNYLLTASQAINIHPGETPQPFHSDDAFYRIARPRRAVSVSTIIAIDPFTDENGATEIIPRSHTWSDESIARPLDQIDFTTTPSVARQPTPAAPLPDEVRDVLRKVTMPAGAAVVFLGTLVHRGGENKSHRPRLAL